MTFDPTFSINHNFDGKNHHHYPLGGYSHDVDDSARD